MTERGAVWMVRVAGSAVLALFVVFQAVNPRSPVVANTPGFRDPVLGFELASRPEHVFGILGSPGDAGRPDAVRRMTLGIELDFLFLLAYPTFYVGIAVLLVRHGRLRRGLGLVLLVLPAVMALGDALENQELLRLTGAADPAAMLPALGRLHVFTLAKWYAIFVASAIVALGVWRERSWWRWSAALFGLAALLGLASVAHLPAIEWTIVPLGLAWTMTYAWALRA